MSEGSHMEHYRGTWFDVEEAGVLTKCCTAQAQDKAKLGRGLTGLD